MNFGPKSLFFPQGIHTSSASKESKSSGGKRWWQLSFISLNMHSEHLYAMLGDESTNFKLPDAK